MDFSGIRKAISDAVGDDLAKRFEIIGFDACLMGTLEIAEALKDVGRYLAASQDIEPGGGWDYTSLLNFIAANPSADGAAIGKAIAEGYLAKVKVVDERNTIRTRRTRSLSRRPISRRFRVCVPHWRLLSNKLKVFWRAGQTAVDYRLGREDRRVVADLPISSPPI